MQMEPLLTVNQRGQQEGDVKRIIKVLFATFNQGKLTEVRKYFDAKNRAWKGPCSVQIYSPLDLGIADLHVEEDSDTLEGNAKKKAMAYFSIDKINQGTKLVVS